MELFTGDNTKFKNQIKDLWQRAFSDPEVFVNAYFDTMWQGENAITMLENGQVIGALQLVPYSLSVRGLPLKCSYIVGVSTAPEHRNRGVAKTLMKAALQKQKERGEVLSLLIPFSYPFYEKMGYATCYQELCYTVKAPFPHHGANGSWKTATSDDWETLRDIYLAFCANQNGYVYRNLAEWQFIFDFASLVDAQIDIFYNPAGVPCAYLYYLKNEKRFRVIEAAWSLPEAKDAVLSHASSLSPFPSFDWLLPKNSTIPRRSSLKDKSELLPSAMARIVDISALMPFGLGGLKLNISDDFCPENNGIYVDSGTPKPANEKAHISVDIRTDIASLSQLVLGFSSCRELEKTGKLQAASRAAMDTLDKLYPKQNNYINCILRDV